MVLRRNSSVLMSSSVLNSGVSPPLPCPASNFISWLHAEDKIPLPKSYRTKTSDYTLKECASSETYNTIDGSVLIPDKRRTVHAGSGTNLSDLRTYQAIEVISEVTVTRAVWRLRISTCD
jgi:hypothetical protein